MTVNHFVHYECDRCGETRDVSFSGERPVGWQMVPWDSQEEEVEKLFCAPCAEQWAGLRAKVAELSEAFLRSGHHDM